MKWVRSILYGIIGFLVAGIGGIILVSIILPPDFGILILFGAPLLCAILGAYLLGSLGRKMSEMEKKSEIAKGNFFVANRIGVIFLISSAAASLVSDFAFPALSQNLAFSTVVSLVIDFLGVWVGVIYVQKKGFFSSFQSPIQIASWIVGILGPIVGISLAAGYVNGQIVGMTSVVALLIQSAFLYVIIYVFSRRGIAQSPHV